MNHSDRLTGRGAILPDQFDRAVDVFESPPIAAGGGNSVPFPFDISLVPDPSHAGFSIATIRPGTVNGLIPSNYATTYSLDDTLVYYLVVSVTASDGAITGVTLSMPTTAPAGMPTNMGQPPLSFDYLIGVVVAGDWFRTIGDGGITATSIESFRTSKTSPAPGTLPYDIWYTWDISED